MCISGGGGGDGGAAAAAKQEKQRTRAITQGEAQIGQLFDGTTTTNPDGTTSTSGGFSPDYYSGLQTDYLNYAQPVLDDQYSQAKKNLSYALANKGLTNSSAAGDQEGLLAKQYNDYETDLQNQALSYSNTQKQNIENSRGQLTSELLASEDPASTAADASRIVSAETAPPAISPLGQFVFNVSNGLASAAPAGGLVAPVGYSGYSPSGTFPNSGSITYNQGGT